MNAEFQSEIERLLKPYPGAAHFIHTYEMLGHAVDDLIDRDNPSISDYSVFTLDVFNLALDLYSSKFYHDNMMWLYPIMKVKHRVYSASIVWEHDPEKWKADYADVLRCCGGGTLLLAVLEHVCHLSYQELRRIDAKIREDAWANQHDKEGKPT